MQNRSKRRRYQAATVLWALVCAALLLVPSDDLPGQEWPGLVTAALEIAAHLVLFLALGWLAARGFSGTTEAVRSTGGASPDRRKQWILAAVLAYCVLLEILQVPVPGRNFELLDLVVGGLGAALGVWSKLTTAAACRILPHRP